MDTSKTKTVKKTKSQASKSIKTDAKKVSKKSAVASKKLTTKKTQKAGSLINNEPDDKVEFMGNGNIFTNEMYNVNGSFINDGNVTITRIEPLEQATCSAPKNVGVKNNTNDELYTTFLESFNIDLNEFPSYTPSATLDKIVPKEIFNIEKQYSFFNFFKPKTIFGKNMASNNTPYKVKVTLVKGNELLKRLAQYNLPDEIAMCREKFNIATENDELVVKITDVIRWRNLMKCYKEAKVHNELYKAIGSDEYGNEIKGEDLVVKPYACCPIYYNNKWRMVFVQGYAPGEPVYKYIKNSRDRKNIYDELIPKLMESCNKLWCLGFVHGDLHSRNAHYDNNSKKVTFIDLESTMKIPTPKVFEYKEARKKANEDLKSIDNKQERARVYLNPFHNVLQSVAQQNMHKVKGWIETLEDCSNSTVVNETSGIFY